MFARAKNEKRVFIGTDYDEVIGLPDLIDIQLSSYELFLQKDAILSKDKLEVRGLEEVFQTVFPIESTNGELVLDYDSYTLDFNSVTLGEEECKRKGLTFGVPVKAQVRS